jgi:UDP-N-acetylbacillosamine N-acetyltransferase
MSELIIYGGSGHATSVANIALFNDPDRQIRFVSPDAKPGDNIYGFAIVPELPDDLDDQVEFFAAVGNNERRAKIIDEIKTEIKHRSLGGASIASIIAKDTFIGREAEIGEGAFIGQGAHIGPKVKVGRNAIINTHAVLDHEVQIGDNSQICPNVAIAGRVKLGDNVFMGIGACVIDNVSVCSNVIIGAGGVVAGDITEPGVYVGVPVRKVK